MRAFVIILLQVVVALVVAGASLPLLLFAVPATQTKGPAVLAVLVGAIFVVLRLIWPRRVT